MIYVLVNTRKEKMVEHTVADLAWFAGFFDGEGNIGLGRSRTSGPAGWKYKLSISITNTHLPSLHKIRDMWQRGSICSIHSKDTPKRKEWSPAWKWEAGANQALYVLELILPYLFTKRAQAEVAIAFQKERQHRKKVWHKNVPASLVARDREYQKMISDLNQGRSVAPEELAPISLIDDQLEFKLEEG